MPAEPGTSVESVLTCLADPTRRLLLDLMASREVPMTASELAQSAPVTRQAIVKHLATMGEAGLVERSKVGRDVRHALRPQALSSTAEWMTALAQTWEARLDRIKEAAEAATRNEDR